MSIRIEITDAARMTAEDLHLLQVIIDAARGTQTRKDCIAPADNPEVGKTDVRPSTVATISGNVDPKSVFSTAAVVPPPTAPVETLAASVPLPPVASPTAVFGAVPVPPAPLVAVPSAPVVSGVTLDTAGLPWAARIHASTRTKVTNGTWKKKKGTDPALVTQVETELRQVMGAPTALPPPPIPAASLVPPPPVPESPFPAFMVKATMLVSSGKLTQGHILQACQTVGITSLPLLSARPDLIPQVSAALDAMVPA